MHVFQANCSDVQFQSLHCHPAHHCPYTFPSTEDSGELGAHENLPKEVSWFPSTFLLSNNLMWENGSTGTMEKKCKCMNSPSLFKTQHLGEIVIILIIVIMLLWSIRDYYRDCYSKLITSKLTLCPVYTQQNSAKLVSLVSRGARHNGPQVPEAAGL